MGDVPIYPATPRQVLAYKADVAFCGSDFDIRSILVPRWVRHVTSKRSGMLFVPWA